MVTSVRDLKLFKRLDCLLEKSFVYWAINLITQKLFFLREGFSEHLKLGSPIFVVGCGHSGTSVMLAVLDNHSSIRAVEGESRVFSKSILERLRCFRDWDKLTLVGGNYRKVFNFIGEVYDLNVAHTGSKDRKWYNQDLQKAIYSVQNHEQYRNWQINQPLFKGSGKWIEDMTSEEKATFKEMAGDLLIEFGYTESDD